MKTNTLITILCLTCAAITGFSSPIVFNFQNLTGSLQGGFLTLSEDGVNAFFGADGLLIDTNSAGTHVLHTGNYQGQMGIEISMPISQIIIGIDGNIPTANNSAQTFDYYGPGDNLYGMPTISSSGSTLVFNVPGNFPDVFGILLDGNSGNGFSIDYVSIQLVPEPAATTLLLLGATMAMSMRRRIVRERS